jgi:hypothetical protein
MPNLPLFLHPRWVATGRCLDERAERFAVFAFISPYVKYEFCYGAKQCRSLFISARGEFKRRTEAHPLQNQV